MPQWFFDKKGYLVFDAPCSFLLLFPLSTFWLSRCSVLSFNPSLLKDLSLLFIRRIPLKEIPCSSIEATSDWCRKAFQDKVIKCIVPGLRKYSWVKSSQLTCVAKWDRTWGLHIWKLGSGSRLKTRRTSLFDWKTIAQPRFFSWKLLIGTWGGVIDCYLFIFSGQRDELLCGTWSISCRNIRISEKNEESYYMHHLERGVVSSSSLVHYFRFNIWLCCVISNRRDNCFNG